MRDDNGLTRFIAADVDETIGTERYADNCKYYRYIFKVKLTRFFRRLLLGYEEKRGIKRKCKVFSPSNWIDELLLIKMRLTA